MKTGLTKPRTKRIRLTLPVELVEEMDRQCGGAPARTRERVIEDWFALATLVRSGDFDEDRLRDLDRFLDILVEELAGSRDLVAGLRVDVSPAMGNRLLEHPTIIKAGKVEKIFFVVPLLVVGEGLPLLVGRPPRSVVDRLIRVAREVPADQQQAFVRDWVMANNVRMLDEHSRRGSPDFFTFEPDVQMLGPRMT